MLRNNSPLKKRLLLLAQTYIENNGYKYGNLIVNNLIPKLELDSYDISGFILGDTTHLYSILVFEPISKKVFFISIEDNSVVFGYGINNDNFIETFFDKSWNIEYCIEHDHSCLL